MYSSASTTTAICSAVFPFLAAIAVIVRFRARAAKNLGYKTDDYLIVAALVFAVATACIEFEGSFRGGIGQPIETLTPNDYSSLQKHLYAAELTAFLALGLVKCSVIMFYKRIFVTRKFNLISNVLLVIVILWELASMFVQIFSAWPISNFWTLGKNLDLAFGAQGFFFAISDILLDLIILLLPFPVIRKLQMSRTRKVQIFAVFWLGLICVVAASVRAYYIYKLAYAGKLTLGSSGYFDHISTDLLIWGQIEPCMSIIAACLPCMATLFSKVRSPESLLESVRSIFRRTPGSSIASLNKKDGPKLSGGEAGDDLSRREWHKLQDIGAKGAVHTGDVEIGLPAKDLQDQDGIRMERSFAHTVENS